MSRYIDADKLYKDEIARCRCVPWVGSGDNNYKHLDEVLEDAPDADVVAIVRCRDCKHSVRYECKNDACYKFTMCRRRDSYSEGVEDDDFCSYGERREES